MKNFLILIVVVALLVLGGWATGIIKFGGDNHKATVEIDKDAAEKVKDKVVEGAEKMKDKAVEGAEKLKEGAQSTINKFENKSSTTVSTTPATSSSTTPTPVKE